MCLCLRCGSGDRVGFSSPVFWDTLQDASGWIHVMAKHTSIKSVLLYVGSLTLFGVWMGDRASRSVIGNSSPRLLRSSYTYTTPTREGELRNASAHDCGWMNRTHDSRGWGWVSPKSVFSNTVRWAKQRLHVQRTERREKQQACLYLMLSVLPVLLRHKHRNVSRYPSDKDKTGARVWQSRPT